MERMGAQAATGKSGEALIQMLTTLTSDYLLRRLDDPDGEIEVEEIRALARVVKERAQAARLEQDFEAKVRERVQKETVKAVEDSAREAGLSAETVEAIKSRILGIKDA